MKSSLCSLLMTLLVGVTGSRPVAAAPACGSVPASGWTKYATNCFQTTNNGWDYEPRAYGSPDSDGGTFCDLCGKSGTGYSYVLSCGDWSFCDPPNADTISKVEVGVYVKGATSNTMRVYVGSVSKNFTASGFKWVDLDVTSLNGSWTWDAINALEAKVDWVSGNATAQYAVDAFRVVVTYSNCSPNASTYCNGSEIRWKDSCGNDGGVKQSCDDGNGCTSDACVGGGSCSNTATPNTGSVCHEGNVHYTDSCGGVGGLLGSCNDGNGCTTDSCAGSLCYHSPTPKTGQVCQGNNVHWHDSCGAVGDLAKSCDDGNGCTTDSCANAACVNNPTPDTSKVCFENDLYFADSCGNRTAKLIECDDGNPCTIDACDVAGGTCQHTEDEVACPKPCVDPPTAKCFDNNVIMVDCKNNIVATMSCSDTNECTIDGCNEGVCKHDPVTTSCACDPAIAIVCQANSLVKRDACGNLLGLFMDCDDQDPCSIDACDEPNQLCQHTPKDCTVCVPDGAVCQGNKLFATDTCDNIGAELDDCEDDDVCTVDGCGEGACTHVKSNDPDCHCQDVITTSCEGNLVLEVDQCGNKLSVLEDCNDKQACTVDGCANGACTHTPIVAPPDCGCDSTSTTVCDANTLVVKDGCGNVKSTTSCDDDDVCTIDVCHADTSTCEHQDQCCEATHTTMNVCKDGVLLLTDSCGNVLRVVSDCNDGNDCTTDGCEVDECVHVAPDPEAQHFCNAGDLVWLDSCGNIGALVEACDDEKECTADDCNAEEGACIHTPDSEECCEKDVGTVCKDGDSYWVDSCGNAGAVAEACPDGDVCTADSCANGACLHPVAALPECGPCPPHAGTGCLGDAVVWIDGCDELGEVIAACDDADPCTTDTCDAKSAKCVHIATPGCVPKCEPVPAPACAQGHLMWVDSCGQAQGLFESCEDGNACTVDGCPAGASACIHTPSPSLECGCGVAKTTICNGKDIVWIDACGEFVSIATTCEDEDPCTIDTCNATTNSCVYPPSGDCPEPGEDTGSGSAEGDDPDSDIVASDAGDVSGVGDIGTPGSGDGGDVVSDGGDSGDTTGGVTQGDVPASGDVLKSGVILDGSATSEGCGQNARSPFTTGLWLLAGLLFAWRRATRSSG